MVLKIGAAEACIASVCLGLGPCRRLFDCRLRCRLFRRSGGTNTTDYPAGSAGIRLDPSALGGLSCGLAENTGRGAYAGRPRQCEPRQAHGGRDELDNVAGGLTRWGLRLRQIVGDAAAALRGHERLEFSFPWIARQQAGQLRRECRHRLGAGDERGRDLLGNVPSLLRV